MKWLGAHCIHPPLPLGETVSLIKSYMNTCPVIICHKLIHMLYINLRSLRYFSLCIFYIHHFINKFISIHGDLIKQTTIKIALKLY